MPAATTARLGETIDDITVELIDNDDERGVTLSETEIAVAENGGRATYTIVLNTEPSGDVTVTLQIFYNIITVDTDSGRSGNQNSLTFTPDNWDTPQTVTVIGIDNDVAISQEADLSDIEYTVTGGDYRHFYLGATTVSVTDDDEVGVTFNPSSLTVTENGASKTYTVRLDSDPQSTVTIFVLDAINEATTDTQSLVFDSGDWNVPKTVTVTPVDDDLDNENERRTGIIEHNVQDYPGYDRNAPHLEFEVTVLDDDPNPTVSLALDPASINESAPGNVATVTATLSNPSYAETTVTVTTSPATGDFTVSANKVLTIPAGNTESTGTVTITAADDADSVRDSVSVRATVSNPGGAIGPAAVTLPIQDDDTAGVSLSAASPFTVAESGTRDYTVRLLSEPTSDVVIDVAVTGSGDVTTNPTQLTFTSGNWSDEQTVTVTAADDPGRGGGHGDHHAPRRRGVFSRRVRHCDRRQRQRGGNRERQPGRHGERDRAHRGRGRGHRHLHASCWTAGPPPPSRSGPAARTPASLPCPIR